MSESLLSRIAVVLYEPQDPVNIAATVRAMKNMGVSTLRLVKPVAYEAERLEGIAHNTRDVIDAIERYETIDEAIGDCVRLVGFTARRRAAKWRVVEPRTAAAELLAAAGEGPVAMLFGREDSGLPNEILDRVHATVVIPTTGHSSMNLAQAVLVGLYELHLAAGDATRVIAAAPQGRPAGDAGAARAVLRRRAALARGDRVLQDAPDGAHHAHGALAHRASRTRRAGAFAHSGHGHRSRPVHGAPAPLNRGPVTFSF